MRYEHFRVSTGDSSIHALVMGDANPDAPTILFSHGFTVPGFESNRMFMRIAERIVATKGWTAVLFDYRGSGYSGMAFEDMTIQTEIADFNTMLDFCQQRNLARMLAVWGMSLGTSVAVEVLRDRQSEVRAAMLWGLSANLYQRWKPRWEDQFSKQGYAILPSGFIVKPSVVEGMRGVDTYASIERLTLPCLLVAGGADAEEVEMSRTAIERAKGNCKLVEIPEGSHGFKGQPGLFDKAYELSAAWLESHLS